MVRDLGSEIRSRLESVAGSALPLNRFEDWFVPLLGDEEERADDYTKALLSEVHLLLAEYSKGDLSKEQLLTSMRILSRQESGAVSAFATNGERGQSAVGSYMFQKFRSEQPAVAPTWEIIQA